MNGLKRIDNIFKREYILERKLNNYIYNHVEYDDATISEMREYAEKKNMRMTYLRVIILKNRYI